MAQKRITKVSTAPKSSITIEEPKRFLKELAEITSNPPPGIRASLVDESNVHVWNVIMDGPSDTPYAVYSSSPSGLRVAPN